MKPYEHVQAPHLLARVLTYVCEHPWNLTPDMLAVMAAILSRHVAGAEIDRAAIDAAVTNRKDLPQPRRGSVAVIPVYGVIAPRMTMMSDISGGTTYDALSKQLRAAMADKAVRTIVLDVDSPGGSVAGNAELAAELMAARATKPIVAQAQYTMASAAYHLAAAATEIVAAPSAQIGSIGTYSIHNDLSQALANFGIKRTYISAGEGKVDGNEAEPLTAAALARRQLAVDQAYDTFVQNVVRGRGAGVTAARVREDWKALLYGAADAKAIGMIDRVATLDETLERLLGTGDAGDRAALQDLTTADTSQARQGSDQDRRRDMELEREAFERQVTLIGV